MAGKKKKVEDKVEGSTDLPEQEVNGEFSEEDLDNTEGLSKSELLDAMDGQVNKFGDTVKIKYGIFHNKVITTLFDEESLKRDFASAGELEKFVYDKCNVSLTLKGKPSAYKLAAAVLNGEAPPDEYLTDDNPYLNKADLIPEDPIPLAPLRSNKLPPIEELVNVFHMRLPHTDSRVRTDVGLDAEFRRYSNGIITYLITGPIEKRDSIERVRNKDNQMVPMQRHVIDPRTPETTLVNVHGVLTEKGHSMKRVIHSLQQDEDGVIRGSNLWDEFINRPIHTMLGEVTAEDYANIAPVGKKYR